MDERPGVIIVSEEGSDTNWLGTTRSLGRMGVKVVRLSPRGWYASRFCSTIISPHIAEEPSEYLRFLIRVGRVLSRKSTCRHILLPSNDRGLILISRNKDVLRDHFNPVVPDWNTTEKIVDKSETYLFAKSLGVLTPGTFSPKDMTEVSEVAGAVRYPCLVKPVYSHIFGREFGIKLLKVESRNMLLHTCSDLLRGGHKVLVQEEVPGGDEQIYMLTTCFNKESEPLAIFTSRKLRQYPPHFGIGSFVESVWEPRIVNIGIPMLKRMRFYGIAMVEFKKDSRTGEFNLLEINGRSHTQNYLATACGLNLAYTLYKDATGEKQRTLDTYNCQFEQGVKWLHFTIDFQSMLQKRREGEITLAGWLRSIVVGRKNFAILSRDDFRPFISELRAVRGLKTLLSSYLRSGP